MSLLKKLLVAAAAAALGSLAIALPAQADTVSVSPPGANDWSCVPSAAHPYPVILVPGTFESMAKNWSSMSPVLKQAGYCVFALDYGQYNGVDASGPIVQSAQQLSPFVNAVLASTKAKQVDLVGHSQGGMMPRYYLGFLGGAAKVHQLIGIAPSNHGTHGVIVPGPDGLPALTSADPSACPACADQTAGSAFLQKLNSIGDTVRGPSYTVISTTHDEVVTPYQSQALSGSPTQVTNTVIQDKCPADPIEHDQSPNDPVVQQLVLEALSVPKGPADPAYQPNCAG